MSEIHVEEQSRPLMDVNMEQGGQLPPTTATTTTAEGSSIDVQQDNNNDLNGVVDKQEDEESTRPRFMPMFDSAVSTSDARVTVDGGERIELGTTANETVSPPSSIPSVLQPILPSATTSTSQAIGLPSSSGTSKMPPGLADGIIQPGPSLSELPGPLSLTSSIPLPYSPFTAPLPANTNSNTMQHTAIAVPPTPASHSLTPVLPLRNRSSCTNCRKRKQRCDHGPPGEACRGCLKGGKVCVYPGGIVLAPTVSAAGTTTGTPMGATVSARGASLAAEKGTPTMPQGSKKSHKKKSTIGAGVRQLDCT